MALCLKLFSLLVSRHILASPFPKSSMRILAIFSEIKSFRLGYTEERPYPWRWTTPIVLCAFLFISPFLALVNVPLSAYNIVQEFTYLPNDTLPAVFLGNLVPSALQNSADSFTPQILSLGYTIMLDNYIFNYTIAQAFDGVDTSKSVSAFPYYNNRLSDSCDMANITIQLLLTYEPGLGWTSDVQVGGTVACSIPSIFYLTWRLPSDEWLFSPDREISIRNVPTSLSHAFSYIFATWTGPDTGDPNITQAYISFTVHPCCDCDAVLAGGPLESGAFLLESPCSSNPPQFVVVESQPLTFTSEDGEVVISPYPPPMRIGDFLAQCALGTISISNLGEAYKNLIQALYHLVRLDLGVILQNQIYNSPEMFNRTIMPIEVANFYSRANEVRDLTCNATVMTQWQKDAEFFRTNERVPTLEYLRSVPRLKPLGSAVTAVFVSTFAMLSVMWTIFSLVAGALARKHCVPNGTLGKKDTLAQSRTWDRSLESSMEDVEESQGILLGDRTEADAVEQLRHRIDKEGAQIRVALARMSAALKKHGLTEDEVWGKDHDSAAECLP
ncbi:hypothetical protein MSAN_02303700 [Mycena sanguinolenta]|uniref:Uncharacterized protein n=1 Tax=Mycena sanguinolenta TaxID=230812 RepID=A0A8H7CGH4_9AGAR|nr:hypothetical protein MSAN_02303700 [Mycena sanguinolenta]